MKKSVLREYARLIVRTGANVQKGQEVMIYAELDQPEFVQMVVEEAYKAKAKKVMVEWNYQPLSKIHVRYQSVKTLGDVPQWQCALPYPFDLRRSRWFEGHEHREDGESKKAQLSHFEILCRSA